MIAKVSDLGLALKVDRAGSAETKRRGTPGNPYLLLLSPSGVPSPSHQSRSSGYMAPELCSPGSRKVTQVRVCSRVAVTNLAVMRLVLSLAES